jgi:hypothetical protein
MRNQRNCKHSNWEELDYECFVWKELPSADMCLPREVNISPTTEFQTRQFDPKYLLKTLSDRMLRYSSP